VIVPCWIVIDSFSLGGKIIRLDNAVNLFAVNKLIRQHFETEKQSLNMQEREPDSMHIE
jgi:hypothetical protein